ncbi:hypothetical protein EJ110_NYTH26846 [Nymphaea thermarum]|nr:hypothetical protein EJ110_NYTH26846 [Nymphaea thermarum]
MTHDRGPHKKSSRPYKNQFKARSDLPSFRLLPLGSTLNPILLPVGWALIIVRRPATLRRWQTLATAKQLILSPPG